MTSLAQFRNSLKRLAAQYRFAFRQRTLMRLMSQGGSFGIISAYTSGPKHTNQIRNGQLVATLQRAGYRKIIPLKGSWEGVTERSLLVPQISPSLLFALGKEFNQDAVIYKSKDGVAGMYYTKGVPQAEIAVDPQGDPAFEMMAESNLFSKARGLSFELGFLWGQKIPWDGQHPVSRKQMRSLVENQLQF